MKSRLSFKAPGTAWRQIGMSLRDGMKFRDLRRRVAGRIRALHQEFDWTAAKEIATHLIAKEMVKRLPETRKARRERHNGQFVRAVIETASAAA